ncbi:hypothetical protein BH10CYA1_BH10CYA1_46900 [soil metagenome]
MGFDNLVKQCGDSSKTLEEKGLLHRFTLHDQNKSDQMSRSEDLYRFSGAERTNKRVEQAVGFEDYEARIKDLEARLAAQTEKLERLIAAQVFSYESTDSNNYSNRPTNLARPADGAHYIFDRSGNGQLIGPHGERQYNLINGERVWLKDAHKTNDYTPQVTSGCSNGSCGSCSSCRPRPRFLR